MISSIKRNIEIVCLNVSCYNTFNLYYNSVSSIQNKYAMPVVRGRNSNKH